MQKNWALECGQFLSTTSSTSARLRFNHGRHCLPVVPGQAGAGSLSATLLLTSFYASNFFKLMVVKEAVASLAEAAPSFCGGGRCV